MTLATRRAAAVLGAAVLVSLAAWLVFGLLDRPDRARGERRDDSTSETTAPPLAAGRRAASSDGDAAPAKRASAPNPALLSFHVVAVADGAPCRGVRVTTAGDRELGTTDDTGRLEAASPFPSDEWIEVTATLHGFAAATASARRGTTCEIRLARGKSLRGRVILAATKEPVAGAIVRAIDVRGSAPVGDDATSDASGRFSIRDARADGEGELVVRAPGRATTVVSDVEFAGAEEIVVELEDGGSVEGRVTDEDGRPMPGVPITVVRSRDSLPEDPRRGNRGWASELEPARASRTTTDGQGRYAMTGIELQTKRVVFAEATPWLVGRSDSFELASAGDRAQRDIRVPAGGTMRIVVSGIGDDDAADLPIRVQHPDFSILPGRSERTPDGAWVLRDLTPDHYEVIVLGFGFPELHVQAEVVAGETRTVSVDFPGGSTLEGQVVTDDGSPAPDAIVWWEGRTTGVGRANAEGRFRLVGLSERPGTLMARWDSATKPAHRLGRARVESVVPGRGPVRLTLPQAAQLRLTVAGLPPSTGIAYEARSRHFATFGALGPPGPDGARELFVDEIGSPVRVTLAASQFAIVEFETPALAAGETRNAGTHLFDLGRTLEMRIVDADGDVIPNAEVWVRRRSNEAVGGITNAAGKATLRFVPRSAFVVKVDSGKYPPGLFRVPPDVLGPVDFRLESEGMIEVHVDERDGSPSTGAKVAVVGGEEDPFDPEPEFVTDVSHTDDTGETLARVRPGVYRLRVRGESDSAVATVSPVVVRSDETTTVRVHLP